jgi:thymidylate synthase
MPQIMTSYLDLVRHVLAHGDRKVNRTGIDTLSTFAQHYKVDISESLPLLTTKDMSGGVWKSLIYEMLWYLSGDHHIRDFEKHSKIWSSWADEDRNLETAYGRFWRRFPFPDTHDRLPGEAWPDMEAMSKYVREEERSPGRYALNFDQIAYLCDLLIHQPNSRRMVMTAWHPANAAVSLLPPCHAFVVFNVSHLDPDTGLGRLNCHLTQRSGDIGLGIPFNLAGYSTLTYILARATGHAPGTFSHTIVDAHIYCGDSDEDPYSHVPALQEQITRDPRPSPTLNLKGAPEARTLEAALAFVDGLAFEDFDLQGYNPHPRLRMKVAV